MSTEPTPSNQAVPPVACAAGDSAPGGNVVRSAKRIAVITLTSRVFGMIRDIAMAAWLGNTHGAGPVQLRLS